MILCLDIGNSTLHGGVFDGDELVLEFRRATAPQSTSDELGLFLRGVLREADTSLVPSAITAVGLCSVVPELQHALRNCCQRYFDRAPFELHAGVDAGLDNHYRNPLEVGADRIANAVALATLYPGRDAIAIDFGTATTFDVVSAAGAFLGGAIAVGPRLWIDALGRGTAKLSAVEIVEPAAVVGRSMIEGVQSGLYYGYVGVIRELIDRITAEAFAGSARPPVIVGAGGFAGLFSGAGLFHHHHPDLVLRGVLAAMRRHQAVR